MHDPDTWVQVLVLLVAVLAVVCWRAVLKLVIAVIAICLTAMLAFGAIGLVHYLLFVLR